MCRRRLAARDGAAIEPAARDVHVDRRGQDNLGIVIGPDDDLLEDESRIGPAAERQNLDIGRRAPGSEAESTDQLAGREIHLLAHEGDRADRLRGGDPVDRDVTRERVRRGRHRGDRVLGMRRPESVDHRQPGEEGHPTDTQPEVTIAEIGEQLVGLGVSDRRGADRVSQWAHAFRLCQMCRTSASPIAPRADGRSAGSAGSMATSASRIRIRRRSMTWLRASRPPSVR